MGSYLSNEELEEYGIRIKPVDRIYAGIFAIGYLLTMFVIVHFMNIYNN